MTDKIIAEKSGEIARIIFNQPEKRNAVSLEMWEAVEVAASRGNWHRDTGAKADLSDLLIVARLHASAGKESARKLPRVDEVPAFRKLPLGSVSEDAQLTLLLEADEEVQDLANMLGV